MRDYTITMTIGADNTQGALLAVQAVGVELVASEPWGPSAGWASTDEFEVAYDVKHNVPEPAGIIQIGRDDPRTNGGSRHDAV